MESLKELFDEQLKDLYNAEKQLTKALPAMAKKASAASLKEAFTSHLEETNGHVQRLHRTSVNATRQGASDAQAKAAISHAFLLLTFYMSCLIVTL